MHLQALPAPGVTKVVTRALRSVTGGGATQAESWVPIPGDRSWRGPRPTPPRSTGKLAVPELSECSSKFIYFVSYNRYRPSANVTSSASSSASPLIQTSLGVANVGGALPSFSTASLASTEAPATTHTTSYSAVSSAEASSSSISSVVTHSTSHVLAPVSSSRFLTSLRSATSPSPSPTPKESPTTEKAETTSTAAPSSSPKPVTTSSPETTTQAATPQTTTAAPASSGSDSTTSSSDISAYLSAHNTIRAQHGASALTWSDELASKAQQWANGCVFQHSGGSLGPFGGTLS